MDIRTLLVGIEEGVLLPSSLLPQTLYPRPVAYLELNFGGGGKILKVLGWGGGGYQNEMLKITISFPKMPKIIKKKRS